VWRKLSLGYSSFLGTNGGKDFNNLGRTPPWEYNKYATDKFGLPRIVDQARETEDLILKQGGEAFQKELDLLQGKSDWKSDSFKKFQNNFQGRAPDMPTPPPPTPPSPASSTGGSGGAMPKGDRETVGPRSSLDGDLMKSKAASASTPMMHDDFGLSILNTGIA
jgi:hypothetical protein